MPSPHAMPDPVTPPERVCLLRLSALGDITHVLPVIRTLQHHWPQTQLTWIIGKTEYPLVKEITGIEFIIFDKARGWRAFPELKKQLAGRSFDILLHMQLSLRASLASRLVRARIKLGFDRARASNLQWLFTNEKITPLSVRQHVLDSFLEFPRHFGLKPVLKWDLPVSPLALQTIENKIASDITSDRPLLVINPCAIARSKNWRNWTAEGYAAVADYAANQLAMQVVLSGGPTQLEHDTAEKILALCQTTPLNLVGKTSLDELLALLQRANIVIAPDTGPVHIASALGTPTIGLYASTNPQRAGPYNFMANVVNRYPQALAQYYQQDIAQTPWGKRIKTAEAMQLIHAEEVIRNLSSLADGAIQ